METTNRPTDTAPDGARGVTQGTDVHRSKIPADDPRLRIERPRARTLRRGPVLAVAAVLALAVAIGLVVALVGGTSREANGGPNHDTPAVATTTPPSLPDVISDGASAAGGAGETRARPQQGSSANAFRSTSRFADREVQRQAREDELVKVRGAGLFVASDDSAPEVVEPLRRQEASSPDTAAPVNGASHSPTAQDPGRGTDPNLQDRKNDFLARAGVSNAEYLDATITIPRSPYEVKAGTVIPTVLITGINSDLPGQIVGQVRENVYDSVSGNFLLVPQGSRLLAAYDSMVAWGQERVLLCWNRLLRPDGTSIALGCMPGVDLSGYAGFADEVDNHWLRIIGGAAVSSLLAATAQNSQGNVTGYQPSFPQVWAGGAAGSINQVGQQLTQKNLQIQPTITVRPGFSVNVLVTRDIVIPPYSQPAVIR